MIASTAAVDPNAPVTLLTLKKCRKKQSISMASSQQANSSLPNGNYLGEIDSLVGTGWEWSGTTDLHHSAAEGTSAGYSHEFPDQKRP